MIAKILYINNTDWSLYNFRLPTLRALRSHGFHTGAVATKGDFWERISDIDELVPIKYYRRRIDILADISLLYELYIIFKRYRPDIVHFFTIKPVIYGSIAAKLARVPLIFNTITGLGTVFCRGDRLSRLLKKCVLFLLYKPVCYISDFIFFQNDADRSFFLDYDIVPEQKTSIVPGSGIDTALFCSINLCPDHLASIRKELAIREGDCVVTMVARMIYEKGVPEFVAAAQIIKARYPHAVFLLVGPSDSRNPTAVPYRQLKRWNDQKLVKYCGRREDIKELLALSDIVVLPSYYAEGIPKILLEAGAMAKPAVTTTIPGCSDVVRDQQTGLLVQPRNVPELVDAITRLIEDEPLRKRLGLAARETVCNSYELQQVIAITVSKYEALLNSKKGHQYGKATEQLNE